MLDVRRMPNLKRYCNAGQGLMSFSGNQGQVPMPIGADFSVRTTDTHEKFAIMHCSVLNIAGNVADF